MKLTPKQIELIQSIRTKIKGCRFVSFTYSPVSTGGKFRYTLMLGTSYANRVASSIEQLRELGALDKVAGEAFATARAELLESMTETKETGQNKRYTKKGVYANLGNGLKLNLNDFTFEVDGIVHRRTVLEPATKSRPAPVSDKAKAKAALRKMLPVGKFRSFRLDEGSLLSAKVAGDEFNMD